MKRLSWLDLIGINLFWLGLNMRNNAVGAIFMPYLVDAFVRPEVRNTALGEMRTAGLVIAMLVQPAMGILSDRSTSRFGRRRPFIFVGVLLDLLFLTLIAMATGYWFLLVAVLLFQFSSNISHGALAGADPRYGPGRAARCGLCGKIHLRAATPDLAWHHHCASGRSGSPEPGVPGHGGYPAGADAADHAAGQGRLR